MPGGPRPGGGPGKRGGDGRSGGARNERGGRSGAGGREAGGGRDARGGRSDGGGRGAPGGRGDGAGRSGGAPGGRRGAEDGGGGSGARATGGRDDGWRGGEAAGRGGGRSGGGAPSGGRDGAGGREAPARGRGVDRRRDAEPSSGGTGSGGASGGDVLYGRNAVHEALRAGRRRVRQVWATDHALTEPWLAGGPGRPNAQRARPDELEDRCGSPGHQGVCALVDPYPYADANQLLAGRDGLVLVLDEVQDVQNLGAICRTAECAGALGVVIPERRSAEVTPAACKASAGAVEHLRVARVKNVADALVKAKANGAWVYGAAMQGPVPWTQPDYAGAVVLVLGAEGRGLRPRVAASCDALVTLPVRGRIDSLNVGAAAAALVYEILRARH